MNKIKYFFAFAAAVVAISCMKEEKIVLQEPFTFDEQYYENIREYKKSEHTLSYCYYAAWAPLEGLTGYKDPASWGERLRGLPDSLDICNLWMGYPSPNPESESYSPVAYADMKYMQEKLGTRFVLHGDAASTRNVAYQGDTINIHEAYNAWKGGDESAKETLYKGLDNHVQLMLDKVAEAGLDGVDVDWEPNIPVWKDHETILYVMKKLNEALKPQEKLVILDVFSDTPPADMESLIDYLVVQCYTPQIGCSVARVDRWYQSKAVAAGIPASKFIACEQGGDTSYALNGGGEWKDANGQQMYTADGSKMYSFEGFARWTSENNMGGWGVFYLDRNYYSASGVPYREFRRGIQVANPTIY